MNKKILLSLVAVLLLGAACQKTPAPTTTPNSNQPSQINNNSAVNTPEDIIPPVEDLIGLPIDNSSGSSAEGTITTTPPQPAPTPTPTPSPAQVHQVSVIAEKFDFSPSVIRVKEGEVVRITLSSKDSTHGLNIPEYNVNIIADAGKTGVGEFTASKKGTFKFHCSVFCGAGHTEMTGSLIVE